MPLYPVLGSLHSMCLFCFLLVIPLLGCGTTQVQSPQGLVPETVAHVVDTAKIDQDRLVRALRTLCAPKFAPLQLAPWSTESIEFESDLELSDSDLFQILALAARHGVNEPRRIQATDPWGNRSVHEAWVLCSIEEDEEMWTRTERWMLMRYRYFEKDLPIHRGSDWSTWEVAKDYRGSPVREWTALRVREGDDVWEFFLAETIPAERALSLLQALGEGDFRILPDVELPESALKFSDGSMGEMQYVIAAQEPPHARLSGPRFVAQENAIGFVQFLKQSPRGSESVWTNFVEQDGTWLVIGAGTRSLYH